MAGEEERTAAASAPSLGEREPAPEAPAEPAPTPATPLAALAPATAPASTPPGTGEVAGAAVAEPPCAPADRGERVQLAATSTLSLIHI
eukprot:12571358-Alexandrium_andersonii.AAC.1